MHITKTNMYLGGAAFIASLLLGGFVLHDRSQALDDHNGARLVADDSAVSLMSLPTGIALTSYDFSEGWPSLSVKSCTFAGDRGQCVIEEHGR